MGEWLGAARRPVCSLFLTALTFGLLAYVTDVRNITPSLAGGAWLSVGIGGGDTSPLHAAWSVRKPHAWSASATANGQALAFVCFPG